MTTLTDDFAQRLDTLERGQEETNTQLAAVERRLDALERGQRETNTRLDALERGQRETNTRLDALEKGQQETNTKLDALEKGLQETNTRLAVVEQRLDDMGESQREMRADLRAINGRFDQLHTALLQNQQEGNARFERLEAGVNARFDKMHDAIRMLLFAVIGLIGTVVAGLAVAGARDFLF